MADEPQRKPQKREQLDSLRERLYDRSFTPRRNKRTELKPTVPVTEAPRNWSQPTETSGKDNFKTKHIDTETSAKEAPQSAPTPVKPFGYFTGTTMPKRRNYRSILILFGLLFFIVTLGLSSVYMFLGGNTISGANITVSITGPSSVGGGEIIPLQVGVTNQNNTPIKAATLILRYPPGTQSSEQGGVDLQREAIPLESIGAGETVNIPIRAVVFGEADEEQQIEAEVEYQVEGSNGIFFREAEPHKYKINSSPVSLTIESLEQVSTGQPIDINFIVRSNSTSVLQDIIVKAEYPFGFDYTSSRPEPTLGQNTWLITELQPDETVTITARGVVAGLPSDERQIQASVGVGSPTNSSDLVSVFSTDTFSYQFEKEFIDLKVTLNGESTDTVVVGPGEEVRVALEFANPLEDTLYDPELSVRLSGTALDESEVQVNQGFYDSLTNTVIFDRNTTNGMEQIQPGKSVSLSFNLRPDEGVRQTPDLTLLVNAKARRIQENNVPESLIGKETRTIKFQSAANLLASVMPHSGPIPPVAEKLTQYTIAMRVESGSSDLANAEVTASLPTYVSWLNVVQGNGDIEYRPNSRTIVWDAGDIDNNSSATVSFTVGFLPSISQVGSTPTLLTSQSFKATDRFTGTIVRDTNSALTTVLSSEGGYSPSDAKVKRSEDE